MSLIILIILILVLFAVLPTWPYSREWGYRPTGGISLLLVVLVLYLLL